MVSACQAWTTGKNFEICILDTQHIEMSMSTTYDQLDAPVIEHSSTSCLWWLALIADQISFVLGVSYSSRPVMSSDWKSGLRKTLVKLAKVHHLQASSYQLVAMLQQIDQRHLCLDFACFHENISGLHADLAICLARFRY